MAEGWTTKQTLLELGVSVATLQRWRNNKTGPRWKYNKSGECIYLASSVLAWKELGTDNPWADLSVASNPTDVIPKADGKVRVQDPITKVITVYDSLEAAGIHSGGPPIRPADVRQEFGTPDFLKSIADRSKA